MKKLLTLLVLCVTLLIGCDGGADYTSNLDDVRVVDKHYSAARSVYSTITIESKDTKLELKINDERYKGIMVGTVLDVKFDNRNMLIYDITFKGEKKK